MLRNDEEGPYTGIGKESPERDEDKVRELMDKMDNEHKDEGADNDAEGGIDGLESRPGEPGGE